ncbi:745_t:CDS:1, partial [Cetraspora pellucida]
MKALKYNLVFITIIILLVILPTSFTQTINYSKTTYTEELYQNNLTTSPHVLYIRHYSGNEGAAVVHIGRINYSTNTTT